MRLIDADKFCNFVNENCTDNLAGLWRELINMQPTAYDVEKVVKQLVEISEPIRPVGWTTEQQIIPTARAIDIVRRGGRSESEDKQQKTE
jgi:hypothetical protein